MGSIKFKNLPDKTDDLNDEDLMLIEDATDTKKISLIKLKSLFTLDSILNPVKESLQNQINSFMEAHNKKYQSLLERNENLETICHNLENDHDHDAERIFELENRLVVQTNLAASLQNDKNDLNKKISQLQVDKDALSDNITELIKQVNDNDAAIVILKSQIKDLQAKCKEAKDLNKNLQDKLDELDKNTSSTINDHFTKADATLTETIDDIMTYIRYYHPDVDTIFK